MVEKESHAEVHNKVTREEAWKKKKEKVVVRGKISSATDAAITPISAEGTVKKMYMVCRHTDVS